MASLDDTTAATRFNSFDVYESWYKEIGEHKVKVAAAIPKGIKPGKHPIIIKFHGGGLVTGDCLFPDWHAAFLIPLMHRNSAIALFPNYRLLPEHSGADIVQDLQDFWMWFHNGGLSQFVKSKDPTIELDFEHVLVAGDSAGGYMALMSALTQPRGDFKAVLAQYPMTNYLKREAGAKFMHGTVPEPKVEVIDEHMKNVKPGTVVSSALPPARSSISFVMSKYDRYLEFFGSNEKLWPIHLVEDVDWLPPTWIVHGDKDTAVSVEDSRAFKRKCDQKGFADIRFDVRPGQEHGFDIELKEKDEKWLKDGLAWVEEKWLS